MGNLDSIIASLREDISFDFKKQEITEEVIKTNLFNGKTNIKSRKQQVIELTYRKNKGSESSIITIYCGDRYVKINNHFDNTNLAETNGLKPLFDFLKKEGYRLIV